MRLGEALELYAVAGQLLYVREGLCHASACKPVERPDQNNVEVSSRRGVQQALELGTFTLPAGFTLIDKLAGRRPALYLSIPAQILKLIFGFLVIGGNAGIDSHALNGLLGHPRKQSSSKQGNPCPRRIGS